MADFIAELKELFSRIRITYRRTPNLTKVIVTVAIVLCMGTLIALRLSTTALKNRTEDLRQEAGALENANTDLEEKIGELGSVQSVVEIAEDELDLVQPGSAVFQTEPAQ